MDRLRPVFIIGFGAAVIGAISWNPVIFCTGLLLMAAAICTVEITETIRGNE